MIKNIVFDLGKVLIDFNPLEYLKAFKFSDDTNQLLCNLIFYSTEWQECDRGKYDKNTDVVEVLCKKNPDYAEKIRLVLQDNWLKLLTIKEDSIEYLKELKSRNYKIYILSNLSKQSYDFIKQSDFFEWIDGGVYSYEVKSCKPDVKIYEELLEKYKLTPEETIFIDDMEENIKMAERFNIRGVVFRNLGQMKEEVEKYL